MKILHVWSIAGVAQVLVKYLRKRGHEAEVIIRQKFDRYGFGQFYSSNIYKGKYAFQWNLFVLRMCRKYDLIHLHDSDYLIPKIKRIYRHKPVILSYHGTRVRNKWNERAKYLSKADLISVNSSDLLEDSPPNINVFVAPNPIDSELFSRNHPFIPGTALHISPSRTFHLARKQAQETAEKKGLSLTIISRDLGDDPIPYRLMPLFLSLFEYYIDYSQAVGEEYLVPNLTSVTALQALALGGKVITSDGIILTGLPRRHDPFSVVAFWLEKYNKII